MALKFHPQIGQVVICDFNKTFVPPEMVKRRPAVVISPRMRARSNLCTVVPLSTSEPKSYQDYHHPLTITPPLPRPYNAGFHWVKGDMLYTVSFDRLSLPFDGKDYSGKRKYVTHIIDKEDLIKIQKCILHGLGLNSLTRDM
ncbi:type II toxin-antitoxin system PemK/MazF family toxin [Endozoicomonas atrinae]|uniref:type II toxin-antitoxin system PemK/MazF family toxin n=1 Tax=Endozoicomonas atrinae TaxID=1333660 RepID=UPI000824BA70|nr:type II toxin-antitoxin system PemK/MazF family toxin [Endozoicomonas atrinae]